MRDGQILISRKIICQCVRKKLVKITKLYIATILVTVGKRSNRCFKDGILDNFKVKISRLEYEVECFIKKWTWIVFRIRFTFES